MPIFEAQQTGNRTYSESSVTHNRQLLIHLPYVGIHPSISTRNSGLCPITLDPMVCNLPVLAVPVSKCNIGHQLPIVIQQLVAMFVFAPSDQFQSLRQLRMNRTVKLDINIMLSVRAEVSEVQTNPYG